MQFKRTIPAPALQAFVKHFWVLEVEEQDIPFSQLLFPFGTSELIFNLVNAPEMSTETNGPVFTQPDSIFTGQFTKPFVLQYSRTFTCAGISFHPWAGNILFNAPAQVFTDKLVQTEDVGKTLNLREQLLDCADATAITHCLENYMLKRINGFPADTLVADLTKAFLKNPSVKEHARIVSSIGLSRRRVEQRFLEATGLPMGLFARKIRFQKAVHLLRQRPEILLTEAGLNLGYYDQPHFIREFKAFSGITPALFVKQQVQAKVNVSELMME